MSQLKVQFSSWQLIRCLVLIVLSMVTLSLMGQFMAYHMPDFPLRDGLAMEFDTSADGNVPTFYSNVALFFCTYLFGIIAQVKKLGRDHFRFHWRLLSIL